MAMSQTLSLGVATQTNIYQHLTYMVVQVPGTSAGNDVHNWIDVPYPSLTSNAITLLYIFPLPHVLNYGNCL